MSNAPSTLHAAFEAAFNSGDADAVTALYEPGAVLMSRPGLLSGLDAIRESYRGILAVKPEIHVETLGMLETGEGIALLHGRWTKKGIGEDGAEIRSEGRSTEVVRRQADGRWLFLIDNPFAP